MNRTITHALAGLSIAGSLALIGGCREQRQEDIPKAAHPQPVGSSVRDYFGRQAAAAEQDDFVIYLYEWDGDSSMLDANGMRRFNRNVGRLQHEPFDFIVQTSGDPRLDDARERSLESLVSSYYATTGWGNVDAVARVRSGHSEALGLYGEEASRVSEGAIGRPGTSGSSSTGGGSGSVSRGGR